MRIAFRGNFQPDTIAAGLTPFSTETHLAGSLEQLGHTVTRLQEDRDDWATTVDACADADMFLWTCTRGMAHQWDQDEARAAVELLNATLPTAAVHLDLFFGLDRAHWVAEEPWFRLGAVFTADGDHDDQFAERGIRHHWSPPACYGPECISGTARREYVSDVAFIGSWQGYGHAEHWPVRRSILDFLRNTYGRRFRCWPEDRKPAVRAGALNNLLASVKVVVGDSCLAAQSRLYFSDRAFEHVGRGGFTVFPYVEALADMLIDGEHIRYFEPGNHAELHGLIEYYLDPAHEDERIVIQRAGQAHVRANHTYAHRMERVLEVAMAQQVSA